MTDTLHDELLIRRMGNNRLGDVFPSYTGYSPLGVFQGSDLAPQYTAMASAPDVARLPANPQPAYGESTRALRARQRDEEHWFRRLLAALGIS